jgi:hypothetical protein
LGCQIEAGSFVLLDQLRQPGVVSVTAQVASLDVFVPEARDEEQKRNQQREQDISQHCAE